MSSAGPSIPLSPLVAAREVQPFRNDVYDISPSPTKVQMYPQPQSPSTPSPASSPLNGYLSFLPRNLQIFFAANIGLLFVFSSCFFFVCMNVTVKYLLSDTTIDVLSLIFIRQIFTFTGSLITLYWMNDPNWLLGPAEVRWQLFARGFFGFIGLSTNYESLKGLSVSDSVAIQFLSPSVTAILGYFVLNESIARRDIMACAACLGGVILVSRPPFLFGQHYDDPERPTGRLNLPPDPITIPEISTEQRAIAVAWAFVSVFGSACAYISIRAIGSRAHALHSMAYFSFMCCVVTLPLILFMPDLGYIPKSMFDFSVIIMIGIFGFIAQTLLTMGLQREKAGRASIALYTQVFFALIMELLLFHTFPSFLSLLGTTIILTSGVWVALGGVKAAKSKYTEVAQDEESAPISRTTSPSPSLYSRRGESSPMTQEGDSYFTNGEGGRLSVPVPGKPSPKGSVASLGGRRRNSTISSAKSVEPDSKAKPDR